MLDDEGVKKIAVLSVAVFAVLSVAVCLGLTDGIDRAILLSIHAGSSARADSVWLFFNKLGGPFFLIPAALVLAVALLLARKYRESLIAFGCMAFSAPLNLMMRHAFHRVRPALWPSLQPNHSFVYGYPGGHATLVAAFAASLVMIAGSRRKLVGWLSAAYVLAVGCSSLYLGVHYPSDLLGGWLSTLAICLGTGALASRAILIARSAGGASS